MQEPAHVESEMDDALVSLYARILTSEIEAELAFRLGDTAGFMSNASKFHSECTTWLVMTGVDIRCAWGKCGHEKK
jgi:hypothetical protein